MKFGKLVFLCPRCELDRTKEMNPLKDICPKCGFDPMKVYDSREDFEKEKREWSKKRGSLGSGKEGDEK